jgi:hypothetical protein
VQRLVPRRSAVVFVSLRDAAGLFLGRPSLPLCFGFAFFDIVILPNRYAQTAHGV